MRTKSNNYSSFHVEVYESDINDYLNDQKCEETWPAGCIITRFMGRLRPSQIHDSDQSETFTKDFSNQNMPNPIPSQDGNP